MKPNLIKIESEYGSLQIKLKDVNILTGDNGSGKTKTLFSLHEYFRLNHSDYHSFELGRPIWLSLTIKI